MPHGATMTLSVILYMYYVYIDKGWWVNINVRAKCMMSVFML